MKKGSLKELCRGYLVVMKKDPIRVQQVNIGTCGLALLVEMIILIW